MAQLIRRSNGVVKVQATVQSHTDVMKFYENMKFRQQFDKLFYDNARSHVSVYLQMVCFFLGGGGGQDSQFFFFLSFAGSQNNSNGPPVLYNWPTSFTAETSGTFFLIENMVLGPTVTSAGLVWIWAAETALSV